MPKYLEAEPHLSSAELERRYRQSKHITERNHYHMIWLMSQGRRVPEVAKIVGYNVERVRQIVRQYNAEGPASLRDKRAGRSGRPCLLSAAQERELQSEVEEAFAQGQPYTGVQVAQRMSEMLGHPVYPARGWELLQRWGHRLKVPRPAHVKRDKQAGDVFKKT
jgi:transposase